MQNYITARHTWNLIGGKGSRYKINTGRKATIFGGIYIGIVVFAAIVIPYFSVGITSLIKLRGYGLSSGNFTFMHYVELFTSNQKGISALLTSTGLAVIASTLTSIIGTAVVLAGGKKGKWKRTLELEAMLPQMLPNIVLVIGLMIFWNKFYKIIPLYNTIGFMIVTYVVMFLPFTIQYVSSALMQMGTCITDAARMCGGGKWYTLIRVELPLIKNGIFAGWMMTFIITFRELVASSLISPPNVLTVSTYIVREFEQGSVSIGMAMAIICVVFTTTALILLNRAIDKRKV